MNCNKHEEKEAVGTCTFCGKFFCEDCLVDINGRNYCRDHVSEAISENKEPNATQPNIIINNDNTNSNTNTNVVGNNMPQVKPKSKMLALLLCFFFGVIGAHRFYVGKTGTAVLYLLTGGLCGVGALVDFIMILLGNFKDNFGMPLA